jgi:DNA ligase-1
MVFAFDCLYGGGEALLGKELRERRRRLKEVMEGVGKKGFFEVMPGRDVRLGLGKVGKEDAVEEAVKDAVEEAVEDAVVEAVEDTVEDPAITEINDIFMDALKFKAEGLMLKSLSSPYMSGSRTSGGWRKLKKDYLTTSAGDTIDVVPIGAWRGQGRKKDWFSPFLLAVWNDEKGVYQTLCR